MGQNLTGKLISATYEDLVQISGSILTDGTGSDITNLTVTSSFATTASYALNASATVNTGSLMVTGSATNNVLTFTKGDGSTFNLTVATGSAVTVNTGSLLVTASISDATITFTKGDASTFGITVNNVVNANSASVATSASYALTASYATNVTPINTGSFYVSSSVTNATVTFTQGDGTIEAVTVNNVVNATSASFATSATSAATATSASYATFATNAGAASTATSASHAVNANNAISASFATTANSATSATTATSASHAVNADTASLAQNIVPGLSPTFTNVTITNDLTVNGTASIAVLNYVTGSATYIGDSFVVVNTDLPAQRYAGLAVFDSGSSPQFSASLEWDGQNDVWLLKEETGNTSVILTGPTGSKGAETFPTQNKLQKGLGWNYLGDSSITDNGTLVTIDANVSASGYVSASEFVGNLTGNASTATSASYAATASYVNLGTSATASFTAAATWSFAHNLNQQPVVVQTFDSNWEEIIPEKIDLIDANNATITFPVSVVGYAVASLGNGITQGSGGGGSSFVSPIDPISYNQGAATSPSLYRSKLTISTPGIYNLHVSESGPYWVDLRPLGTTNSGSINIYMWADQLSTFSAYTGSAVVFSGQSGSGNYVSYRVIITGSSSTEYWVANTTVGASTSNLSRTATQERRDFGGVAGNPNTVVKYPDGTLMFTTASGNTALPGTLHRFTGSNGTPIA